MTKSWLLITSIAVLVLLVFISIVSKTFNGWTFFAVVFYIVLYLGAYSYVKIGIENRKNDNDITLQRRNKFDHTWERINQILKSMPGGQGIEWASGVGRKSWIKSYFDGVQTKPFRCVLAHLEYTQQVVMIIFDIEGDDIAEFITNPAPELMDNPFLQFKPFARGGAERDDGLDRFGGYNNSRRYSQPMNPMGVARRPGGGVSVNIDGIGGALPRDGYDNRVNPPKDIVDNAINKLK